MTHCKCGQFAKAKAIMTARLQAEVKGAELRALWRAIWRKRWPKHLG